MKRLLLALLLSVFLFARAEAQAPAQQFGVRFGIHLLLLPGLSYAVEVSEPRGGIGIRANFTPAIFVNRIAVDVYLFAPISDHWEIYFGGGMGFWFGPLAPSSENYNGVIGVRLKQGFFLEFNPSVVRGIQCVASAAVPQTTPPPPCASSAVVQSFAFLATLGFSWRL